MSNDDDYRISRSLNTHRVFLTAPAARKPRETFSFRVEWTLKRRDAENERKKERKEISWTLRQSMTVGREIWNWIKR